MPVPYEQGSSPRRTILRPPADCFRHAISSHPSRAMIRPDRARDQHRAYREVLAALGLHLVVLPADEEHPDACFAQDPAVVLDGRALLARPRHPARRAEVEAIGRALAPLVDSVERVIAPATLEGGDVLRVGDRLVAGSSSRTNDDGIAAVRAFSEPLGYEVRAARVPPGILHLQTAVSAVGGSLVLGLRDLIDQPAFDGLDRVVVGDDELAASNVLRVGTDVVASGRYRAHGALERMGFTVHVVDLSEFLLADGGPTCLALAVDHLG
jgi:dimethylargininase